MGFAALTCSSTSVCPRAVWPDKCRRHVRVEGGVEVFALLGHVKAPFAIQDDGNFFEREGGRLSNSAGPLPLSQNV